MSILMAVVFYCRQKKYSPESQLMPRPEIILFDAVGTVIQPVPSTTEIYHAKGRHYGSQLDRKTIQSRFHATFQSIFYSDHRIPADHRSEMAQWRQLVGIVFSDVDDVDELFDELWDHFARPASWKVFDDVAACWQRLRDRDWACGLASNFDDRLLAICDRPPFDLLQAIFWSGDIGIRKPHKGFYRAVEQRLGLPPDRILLVGDDLENDVVAPGRCGWQTLHLDRSGLATGSISNLEGLELRLAGV